MGLVPKSHSGRRPLVMVVIDLLNLAASLLNAPDRVYLGSIAALITVIIWTLTKSRRGEESD